ncbi:MAG TPA: bifunctional phosphopantothenoylcysteine decarboxylase/phosphopantothenate--cysteine ligase CoaBC [Syntrophales bacterium]|nr:bifunctional phosphopantothenoylcysteine decarboxylase/phosphopantothenate--cysteine ligase CoaBC [Syntrophales bacterium]HON98796.1 bifunctional phosphopantothenoylcysteine decarboxylase/phosphopantothenate--cysteine ligase CoaBC [Syntrophales bacterium]HPQ06475.1 bifunctional phosphopantothenoylcysteine decarboxylase/phosphopantothenate--cysteine ligase CoaBC [Syntrophales bacterium]HRS86837.1 bifunctional phosphopantothenoylcysteine decarboxylase/phosphopantothenate--cysteine ligase CoaBC 
MLRGKRVVLGVCGGIAAYKAAELTRELIREGAEVRVVMTQNATRFVTPLTFQVLSGRRVLTDTFGDDGYDMNHIALADYAELMIIAPATANMVGKAASGIADDLLSTTVMTLRCPVLFCPAMNAAMYESPIVQDNLEKLRRAGFHVLEPAAGDLACGVSGKGRLPEISLIVTEAARLLSPQDLAGERILVTAGPTREPFDPVRFITNYSSGKMGYALAAAARRRGAEVVLVSGPVTLPPPYGVEAVMVESAREMFEKVMEHLERSTVIIKAAAVADYRPAVRSRGKIKKTKGPLILELERNPDIIAEVGKRKGDRILVGFAMESENLVENAAAKMKAKGMDFIVANDLNEEGAGFQHDTNKVRIIMNDGSIESLPLMDKLEVAHAILDRVKKLRRERKRDGS